MPDAEIVAPRTWRVEHRGEALWLTWDEYKTLVDASYDSPGEALRMADEFLTRVQPPE